MRKEAEYQKELYKLGRKWVGPHGVELLTLVFDSEELREARRRFDGELEVTIHLHMGRVDSVFAELSTGGFLKLKVNPNADTCTQTAAEHRRSLMRPSKTPEPFPYGRPASGGSLSLFPPKKGSD